MTCQVPPPGWSCSRKAGHDGPCAASPTTTLTSNEHVDHKRWLAETWQMIERCAASLNPMERVNLSPAGCKALIETRSAEYCRGRDDQMKAAADQQNPSGFPPRSVHETKACKHCADGTPKDKDGWHPDAVNRWVQCTAEKASGDPAT